MCLALHERATIPPAVHSLTLTLKRCARVYWAGLGAESEAGNEVAAIETDAKGENATAIHTGSGANRGAG